MAIIAHYESIREVGRKTTTNTVHNVWSARFAGDSPEELRFEQFDSEPEVIVKLCMPRTDLNDPAEADAELADFHEQSSILWRLHGAGAARWVAVKDSGKHKGGLFVVTPYYPRTALALTGDMHQRISAAELHAIVSGVIAGLLELKRAADRSHGAIKASNVILAGEGPVLPEQVLLTDPAANAAGASEAGDLRAVGALIYELVMHEPPLGARALPAPAEPWNELGRTGETWRALCQRLLTLRPDDHRLTLAKATSAMRTLDPRPRRRTGARFLKAATILLVLSAILGLAWWQYDRQWNDLCANYQDWAGPLDRQMRENPNQFTLALEKVEYLKARVLPILRRCRAGGDLRLDPHLLAEVDPNLSMDSLQNAPPWRPTDVVAMFASHSAMDELLQNLKNWGEPQRLHERARAYNDVHLAHLAAYTQKLASNLTPEPGHDMVGAIAQLGDAQKMLGEIDAARAEIQLKLADLKNATADQDARITDLIGPVQAALTGAASADASADTPEAIASLNTRLKETNGIATKLTLALPVLRDIALEQRRFETRAWTGPATALDQMLRHWSPYDPDQATSVQLSETRVLIDEIETYWSHVANRRQTLEAAGDTLLKGYAAYVHQSLGNATEQENLPALHDRLEAIDSNDAWNRAAAFVASDSWRQIDRRLLASSPAHAQLNSGAIGTHIATDEELAQWLKDVREPRYQLAMATPPPATGTAPPTTHEVVAVIPPASHPATVASTVSASDQQAVAQKWHRGSQAIENFVGHLNAPLASLSEQFNQWQDAYLAQSQQSDAARKFIDECRTATINAAAEIQTEWHQRNQQFAAEIEKNPALLTQDYRQARFALKDRLLRLDAQDRALPALELPATQEDWDAPLRAALQAGYQQARHDALIAALALTRPEANATDDQFAAAVHSMQARCDSYVQQAKLLQAEMQALAKLLQNGWTPDDPRVAALLSRWQAAPLLQQKPVADALAPVLAPLALLSNANSDPARIALASNAAQPLGVRLPAWLKISLPMNAAELQRADEQRRALITAAAALTDAKRSAELQDAIAVHAKAQWDYMAAHATTAADIDTALSLRDAFGRTDIGQVDARMRFNWLLRDLRTELAKGEAADPKVPEQVRNLRAAAEALPDASHKDPSINALVQVLRTWTPDETRTSFEALGPMSPAAAHAMGNAVRWSAEAGPGDAWVTYRARLPEQISRDPIELTFRRIDAGRNTAAYYLCTTPVTMGQFMQLLTAAGRWNEVHKKHLLWEYDPAQHDPRPGPRTWEWVGGSADAAIGRSLVWLSSDWIGDGVDHYPESLAREFNTSVLRAPPGLDADAVNPSPRQPMQYVSINGANYFAGMLGLRLPTPDEWETAYAALGRLGPANLRDRAWALELRHLKGFARQRRPDEGSFIPKDEKPADDIWHTADGHDFDDGVLWFREVVTPTSPASTQPALPAMVDFPGNVCEFVQDAGGKVYIIGASALSPPARPVDRPFDTDPASNDHGYSDVGLRLAFSGPQQPMQRLLAAMPPKDWYLTAAK